MFRQSFIEIGGGMQEDSLVSQIYEQANMTRIETPYSVRQIGINYWTPNDNIKFPF